MTICSYYRIALWPSAGKRLTSWLSASAVLLYAVLIVCVPFLFGVWGRLWNSIVSVPNHFLFINFDLVIHPCLRWIQKQLAKVLI